MGNSGSRKPGKIVGCIFLALGLAAGLGLFTLLADDGAKKDEKKPIPIRGATLRGRWVLDHEGRPTLPESFTRGLQTSALEYSGGRLWSLGDQRSQYPGHIFTIDPRTARLVASPVRPGFDADLTAASNPECEVYRGIPNSDFEALCRHPGEAGTFFAVTEDKVPWVVELRLDGPSRATFTQFSRLEFPEGLVPWRDDTNFRFEGATISDDGRTMYVAFERAQDELPRILSLTVKEARAGKPVVPREVPFPFDSIPGRADKPRALLNINGLAFFRDSGRSFIAAVARDQERILFLDLDERRIDRVIDLALLDPDGQPMHWVSPEGVAIDLGADRLWLINDPDSVRGNYRALADDSARGPYAEYTPLLFEMKFSELRQPEK